MTSTELATVARLAALAAQAMADNNADAMDRHIRALSGITGGVEHATILWCKHVAFHVQSDDCDDCIVDLTAPLAPLHHPCRSHDDADIADVLTSMIVAVAHGDARGARLLWSSLDDEGAGRRARVASEALAAAGRVARAGES